MELISEIINELVNSSESLTTPLLKTKVWAARVQNKDLLKWVNNEVNGYGMDTDLPEYRIYRSELLGAYIIGNMHYSRQPLFTGGLRDDLKNALTHIQFKASISTLEGFIKDSKSRVLTESIPPEINLYIEEYYKKIGNPFFNLLSSYKSVSIEVVNQMLTNVRSKLLEFMLEIEKQFGIETKIEDFKKSNDKVNKIMNNTIITKGDKNVVTVGDENEIFFSIIIKKGDKDSLRKRMSEYKIVESDIDELLKIIDTDKPDIEKKKFGKKVNEWISKMLSKSLNGAWNVGLGAAGNILSSIIMSYYGM